MASLDCRVSLHSSRINSGKHSSSCNNKRGVDFSPRKLSLQLVNATNDTNIKYSNDLAGQMNDSNVLGTHSLATGWVVHTTIAKICAGFSLCQVKVN